MRNLKEYLVAATICAAVWLVGAKVWTEDTLSPTVVGEGGTNIVLKTAPVFYAPLNLGGHNPTNGSATNALAVGGVAAADMATDAEVATKTGQVWTAVDYTNLPKLNANNAYADGTAEDIDTLYVRTRAYGPDAGETNDFATLGQVNALISDSSVKTLYGDTNAHAVLTSYKRMIDTPSVTAQTTVTNLVVGTNFVGSFYYTNSTTLIRRGDYQGFFWASKSAATDVKAYIELVDINTNAWTTNVVGTSAKVNMGSQPLNSYIIHVAITNNVESAGSYLGVRYYLVRTGNPAVTATTYLGGTYATHLDTPGIGPVGSYVTGTQLAATSTADRVYSVNVANHTNFSGWYTLSIQDPTNGLSYAEHNPYPWDMTIDAIRVISIGETGVLDVGVAPWDTADPDTLDTLVEEDIVANGSGAEDAALSGATVLSNNACILFQPNELTNFVYSTRYSIHYKLSKP